MSFARTALRLTTVEAMRPAALAADAPTWPTLAGRYVFDSRLDPIDDLNDDERRPIAVVYTEDDNGEKSQAAGGPPFKRFIDLVIEMSVMAMVTADGTDFYPGTPFTDAQLEASLDAFEAQVRFALFYGPTGALWRQLTGRRVTEIHSMRHASSEEGGRLALRTLRMKCTVPDDAYVAAPTGTESGNDKLPEPLKSVVAALATGGYADKIAAGLAATAPQMPPFAPLDGVSLVLQPSSPPSARDDSKPQINAVIDGLQS
ncbi:MAG: hypothetical protein GC182_08550 [Rhodopseudomonas sp.]|nr:hypothetical protein [Rhodopseudomonas sp.]